MELLAVSRSLLGSACSVRCEILGSPDSGSWSGLTRRRDALSPWRAGAGERCGRLGSSCGSGSRASSCDGDCAADTCVSLLFPLGTYRAGTPVSASSGRAGEVFFWSATGYGTAPPASSQVRGAAGTLCCISANVRYIVLTSLRALIPSFKLFSFIQLRDSPRVRKAPCEGVTPVLHSAPR